MKRFIIAALLITINFYRCNDGAIQGCNTKVEQNFMWRSGKRNNRLYYLLQKIERVLGLQREG